ncbi:MAG: hypothetical protein NTX33_19570 [Propionibacteriales bacterium]|nr:hypothetical protein [Propionibacteriales bacterium]
MTDHENQLRGLLHAAVPDDASSLDPKAVSAAARRARHRNRLVVLGASAATVALVGVAGVIATSGPDKDRAAEEPTTTAPYDAPACPATLPELEDANTTTGSLDGVVSIRLCPDLAPEGMTNVMSAEDQQAVRAGMDALVFDIDSFRAEAAALPVGIDDFCASALILNNRQSLQFTIGDRTVLVPTPACGEIDVEGRKVDGGKLATAFLAALDRQRDELDYARNYTGPLACGQQIPPSPPRPGREQFVGAVLCPAYGAEPAGNGTPLNDEQLAALEAAWQNPGEVADDVDDTGANICTEIDESASLLVATDHGDVVRLADTPCGWLHWNSWQPGDGAAIPTTFEALGLD